MKAKKEVSVRLKEMVELRKKFDELGLDPENEHMKILIGKMNEFVKDGIGFSGKISLDDYGRIAICKFSMQPHSVSTVVLRSVNK